MMNHRKNSRAAGLLVLIGAVLFGAVAAFGAVGSSGPDYDPGARPVIVGASSASDQQKRAFPALGRKASDQDRVSDVELQAFEIGQLYEHGATPATARFGADDGSGHRAALVPAKDESVCILASSEVGTTSTCQTIEDAALGRLFTADYPRAGGLRITGGLPGDAAEVSLVSPDGEKVSSTVTGGTYILATGRRDGGELAWSDATGEHSIAIPDTE